MTGKMELPLNLGKTACEYLQDLKRNLEMAQHYAKEHDEKAQGRYVARYNLRAREKSFQIGDKVLILTPDSTSSKFFSRWVGPAVIKDKVSAHSYLVDMDGAVKHLHADKLRKYHINVEEISCDTISAGQINTKVNHCAIIHEEDQDFGDIGILNTPNPDRTELLPSQRNDMESFSSF